VTDEERLDAKVAYALRVAARHDARVMELEGGRVFLSGVFDAATLADELEDEFVEEVEFEADIRWGPNKVLTILIGLAALALLWKGQYGWAAVVAVGAYTFW
jgi:hypothetical protein